MGKELIDVKEAVEKQLGGRRGVPPYLGYKGSRSSIIYRGL